MTIIAHERFARLAKEGGVPSERLADWIEAITRQVNTNASGGILSVYDGFPDGLTDNHSTWNTSIAGLAVGGEIHGPAGRYFFSDEPDVINGLKLTGAGMPFIGTKTFQIDSIVYNGTPRYYDVQLSTTESLARIQAGNAFRISGVNSTHNDIHEVKSVNDTTKVITIIHNTLSSGGDVTGGNIGTGEIELLTGGTLLTFQSDDGTITSSRKFMDITDPDNMIIRDIGFEGPGVNASGGGGIRFRRDTDNEAITGVTIDDVYISHVAEDAIVIEGPVASNIGKIRGRSIAGDALVLKPSPYGGSLTSIEFGPIYMGSCRRGIVIERGVYFTMDSPVVEGASVGFFFDNCSGFTLNSIGSETLKQKYNSGGNGVTLLCVGCYGFAINAPVVFYNTEVDGWAKAGLMFIRTARHAGGSVINGGRYHQSIAQARKTLATEHVTGNDAKIYVDATEAQLDADNWKVGRVISVYIDTATSTPPIYQNRHVISGYRELDISLDTGGAHYNFAVDPTIADTGYNVGDTWTNTVSSDNFKFFGLDALSDAMWREETKCMVVSVELRTNDNSGIVTSQLLDKSVKLGRNYGVDIATSRICRVFESQQSGTTLTTWIDVQDRMPIGYVHKVDFGGTNTAYDGEFSQREFEIVDVGGTNYLRVEFSPGGQLDASFDWLGSTIQPAPGDCNIRVDTQGWTETFYPSHVLYDEAGNDIFFYFQESEFFAASTVVNAAMLLEDMNGTFPVTASVWESSNVTTQNGTVNLASMKLTLTSTVSETYSRTEDHGVYMDPDNDFTHESPIQLIGGNHIRIFDPFDIIGMAPIRTGKVSFGVGVASIPVTFKNAEFYNFTVDGNGTSRVYVSSVSGNTVTLTRGSTSNAYDAHWSARYKKNPGHFIRLNEESWA